MANKQSKNYIGFVNDHSGSMSSLASAAARDYNTNITAIKDAATREMLDTVVSVIGIGL
uniref:VWFA domain-containing protein n=1 Tax=Globodera pallida TaxID=36090 RepID=A0A183CQG1_GLOPA